ncbi:GNAT family N-acetyltransferase [Enterococcus rivorum]|uniref:GNAT family N-acetyltransferase n=1 Tax=Enterococcus rivorum TaxID=762845 RepID=A0A1E5L1A8_9ENTE|nr:GNAT family N-acetyltransferase [Enterococcus rivorum]MBP2098573.1 GNAT superfamily N-acetyltransferase [Enterococcus rivorum]OEH83851.1 GNAT family N-acetyltransferase [Enterococcus rivorum]
MLAYREATKEDIPLIYKYIKELAAYEGLADEVTTNEQILEEWIFDKKGAEVIFPEIEGKEIGFCLYFYNFSTFLGRSGLYIEDLFIEEKYRGKGYGKQLLNKMFQIAKEKQLGRVEWWCLDENKASIDFYKAQGAQPMDEWTVFRVETKDV